MLCIMTAWVNRDLVGFATSPLDPQLRKFWPPVDIDAPGQKQTHALQQAGLFDHLVGSGEQ
jgi:hypothetical protein